MMTYIIYSAEFMGVSLIQIETECHDMIVKIICVPVPATLKSQILQ